MKRALFYIRIILPVLMLVAVLSAMAATAQPPATAQETKPPDETEVKTPEEPPAEPPAEQEEHATGYIRPRVDLSGIKPAMPEGETRTLMGRLGLPAAFDWRDQEKLTPVKDQGSCGSCYAFAGIGQVESRILITDGETYDFSENNAKECNWTEISHVPDIDSWNNCIEGGDMLMVVNLFTQKGLVLESADPYVASDVSCNSSAQPVKTVLDWRIISGNTVPDTGILKQYIYDYGPVFTALYVSFTGFTSTNAKTTTFYYTGTEEPNHAVVIVGWDDSLVHAGGTGGWICKNSWDTSWGDNGYFTIAYGSASIGTDSAFIYQTQDYDALGGLMYYDEGGWTGSVTAGTYGTLWGLCKFIPSANASVTRVEFWTTRKTDDVDIYLYDSFNGSAPSGLLAQKLNQSFNEAGYHSVVLDSPLPVTTNNDVVVVVKFTNNTSIYGIAVDDVSPRTSGSTYLSETGAPGSWEDASNYDCEVAIRLRTATPPMANFSANPTSGSAPLNVNFTDQSTGSITGWSWSFGDGGTSTGQNPSHQYTTAGTYNVTLTVTGPAGSDTETKNNHVTVIQPAPVAAFTADVTSGGAPLNVNFTDQSTGTVTSRSWNFGDGGTSAEQNPSHQYTIAGSYTVSLTVTGPGGTDDETKSSYITVTAGALDHIVISPASAVLEFGGTKLFTPSAYDQYNNQISSGLSYTWSVVNGGGEVNTEGLFTAGDTYGTFTDTVKVEASQNEEITKQSTATVIIGAKVTATAILEGGDRTESGMEIPLTLNLYDAATVLDSGNILTATPQFTFTGADGYITITNKNTTTKTITFEAKGLPVDTFNVALITPHALINLKNGVVIAAEGISVDMGTLLEGNADESDQVTGADFSLLLNDYASTETPVHAKWNGGRCDFDRSGNVDSVDYALMVNNYNKTSPQTVN